MDFKEALQWLDITPGSLWNPRAEGFDRQLLAASSARSSLHRTIQLG